MYATDDSTYTQQLSRGHALLRFEQPLEREFRAYYTARNLPFVRIALILGLVFVGGLSLLNWQLRASEFAELSSVLRLGLAVPMISVSLLATFPGNLTRYAALLFACTGAVIGGGSVVLFGMGLEFGATPNYAEATAVTLFLYLLLGLRFYSTLWLTLPLLGGFLWVGGILAQPSVHVAYDILSLLFVNLAAGCICYRWEYSARTSFLEGEIANVLAGNDALTGIPNRKIFNTHLQSVRRQAERESHGMAVALVELDHLEAFRRRYGPKVTDACLRRAAHAIMRSARRPLDFVARYSGEKFAIVLYDPDERYVEETIAQVRSNVTMLDIPHDSSPTSERVTVSIGVAVSPPGKSHRVRLLLEAASVALEEARSRGNDGIVVKHSSGKGSDNRVFVGPWKLSASE